MAIKKGLVFLHFIWPKNLKNLKWKYLSVKEVVRAGIY